MLAIKLLMLVGYNKLQENRRFVENIFYTDIWNSIFVPKAFFKDTVLYYEEYLCHIVYQFRHIAVILRVN